MFALLFMLAADPSFAADPGAPATAPEAAGPRLVEDQLVLPAPIYFEYDKGEIRPESWPTLDALAAFLQAHPELTRVEIAVHGDGVSRQGYSLKLTQRRADAMAEALVERGVARERLDPKGYENEQPLIPHDTPEARTTNRRVELWVRETAPPALRLEGDQLLLPEKIYFDLDKARIKPESLPTLDAVAAYLIAHPELTRLEVSGHTDDRGSSEYSTRLTQRRAEAVAQALVERGVAPERLVAVGYEEDRPIASNATPEGRAMNRRVELRVLERE
ncbi:MAG: OmpA family protein [Alphaproteobacteria bacterium]|nr:OmpA family protein [Alphaproteobacteria bacterium]